MVRAMDVVAYAVLTVASAAWLGLTWGAVAAGVALASSSVGYDVGAGWATWAGPVRVVGSLGELLLYLALPYLGTRWLVVSRLRMTRNVLGIG